MSVLELLLLASAFIHTCTNSDQAAEEHRSFRKPCFQDEEVANTCASPTDKCHEPRQSEFKLHRLDGVKTGHVTQVELEENKMYSMITRAMRPLLFELPNFLSDEECDHIIKLAIESGLQTSIAGFNEHIYDGDLEKELSEVGENRTLEEKDSWASDFRRWDNNSDGVIDQKELQFVSKKIKLLFIAEDALEPMFEYLGFKGFKDGKITREAFEDFNIKKLLVYLDFLKIKSPRYRARYSQQAWLRQSKESDPTLQRLHERIIKLTQLPRKVIQGGEAMQVVRYTKYGHYHGHLDSNPSNDSTDFCCHQNHFKAGDACKVCRFITILYFLSDVEEGGQTAFLLADNDTVTPQDLEGEHYPTDEFNLSVNCDLADRVIYPKKGTAIMWYNHFVDSSSGLLGPIDRYSLHGGCDVINGIKWIANNWITAPYKHSVHIRSVYDIGFD